MGQFNGISTDEKSNSYYDVPFKITPKIIIIVLLLCFAFLIFEAVIFNNTWDDAYISYRYAKNFAENSGLVFNVGEYVEGYTTFLWVFILGLLAKLGFDIPSIGKILCVLFGLGTVMITYLIGRKLDKKYSAAAVLAALLLTFRIDYGVHFQSGMETSFHVFMLSLAFYSYMKRYKYSFLVTGFLAALLPLIHPEGILFAVAIIINELLQVKNGNLKKQLKNILVFILPIIVILLTHLLWRYSYYGDLLPNTFYTKTPGFDIIKYIRGGWYLLKFFIYGGGILYFIPAIYFMYCYFKNSCIRTLVIIILLYSIFNVYASGDWAPYSRFYMPVVPFIAIASAFGILKLLTMLKAGKLVSILVISAFVFAGYQHGVLTKAYPTEFIFKHRKQINDWKALCEHFRHLKEQRPNLVIASNPIGAIGYYSEAHIIDMLGLTNKHIAKEGKRIKGAPGHERWDIEYVLNLKPDIIYACRAILLPDGRYKPSLGEHTSRESYQRIWDEYERRYIPYVGEYWIRKDIGL
ncbi:MAG: hypothetical protein J7K40_15515 [candidate division Zixibacteria bacterium]|nr:hypothetical protein [candidate division Zixibacteria bacterium]